jgi:formylglycine-generating enzyme required for sulfatase activity
MRARIAALLLPMLLLFGTAGVAGTGSWPDLSRPPKGDTAGAEDAAVLIGIEDYTFLSDIPGAVQNVQDWATWLNTTRGVPAANMFKLTNSDATDINIRDELRKGAAAAGPGGTLWVVYVGHGAPGRDGEALFVGADAQPTVVGLEGWSVPRGELDAITAAGRQARTVLLLDTCFAGQGVDGAELIAEPLAAVRTPPALNAAKGQIVLAAASEDQYAGLLPGLGRPAYSYLVLGALRGWGDEDGDGLVTASEANRFAQVTLGLVLRGRRQTPLVEGDTTAVLGRGRDAKPDLSAISIPTSGNAKVTPTSAVTTGGGFEDLSLDVSDALKEQGCADDARAKGQAARSARLAAAVKAAQSEASVAWSKLGPQAEACLELRDASLREGCAKTVAAYVTRASSLKVSLAAGTEDAETACGVRRAVYPAETVAVAVAEVGPAKGLAAKLRGAVSSGASWGGSPGSAWTSPTLGTMRWIPAGSFTMGSPTSEEGRYDDEVQHRVTLTKGFWMMEHEVTQGEWAAVMGSNPVATGTGFYNGQELGKCSGVGVGDRLPVVCVSWEDVVKYAEKVSARDGVRYRLPTESEWEYAARGGSSGAWSGASEESEVCRVGNVVQASHKSEYTSMGYDPPGWSFATCEDGFAGLAPVGSFRANGYGLYDTNPACQ